MIPIILGDLIGFALTYGERSYKLLENHVGKKLVHEKKLVKLEKIQTIASFLFIVLFVILFIVTMAVGVFK